MKFYTVQEDYDVLEVCDTKGMAIRAAEETLRNAVKDDYNAIVRVIEYDIPVNSSRIKALLMGSGYANSVETVWKGDTRDYS